MGRRVPAAVAAAGIAVFVASATIAQERIVAIVHPRNPVTQVSGADLRNMFLGREKFWEDGTPVQPHVRPESSDAGRLLHRQVLRMTPARFRHHWQGLQLSGRGTAPGTVTSGRAAIARVAAARGGLSIVTASEARGAGSYVKVVEIR